MAIEVNDDEAASVWQSQVLDEVVGVRVCVFGSHREGFRHFLLSQINLIKMSTKLSKRLFKNLKIWH